MWWPILLVLAAAPSSTVAAAAPGAPVRLRVNYLVAPLSIDEPRPRVSWALAHAQRAQAQTSFRLVVTELASNATVWDSGEVASNRSVNVQLGADASLPLRSDADYAWAVAWRDAGSPPAWSAFANSTFSTALLDEAAWRGAEWVGSNAGPHVNALRAEFNVSAAGGGGAAVVARARLFISGLGSVRTTLNGLQTDAHELGQHANPVTSITRALYDVVDVTALVNAGACNVLGAQLGGGWWAVKSWPWGFTGQRQLRALLSVTTAGGVAAPQYFASRVSAPNASALSKDLRFAAAAGPVTTDYVYDGETYDARVAAALVGWDASCAFNASAGAWRPADAPGATPASYGAVMSAHHLLVTAEDAEALAPVSISRPAAANGSYVFDFGVNRASQDELRVEGPCAAGSEVTILHGELLHADGTVWNQFLPSVPMATHYVCAGLNGTSEAPYRSLFSSFGGRYAQVSGLPSAPTAATLASRFVHSALPQVARFDSSSAALNALQAATRRSLLSNMMVGAAA